MTPRAREALEAAQKSLRGALVAVEEALRVDDTPDLTAPADDLMHVASAARALNTTTPAIVKRCRRGQGRKVGGRWWFLRARLTSANKSPL